MNKKTIISIVVIVILVVAVASIVWWQGRPTPAPKYTGPVEKLTLAAYPDYAYPVYIAKTKGFFAENGLDVTIKSFEAGRLAMDALLKNEADIATAADFVFVSDSFDHDDIMVFGTVTTSETTHELIARKDSGIDKIADLKGKKVGVTKKTSGEYYLGTFLIDNNLAIKDIQVVDLKPSEIIEALSKGEIDAALTWESHLSTIKNRLGRNVISFPGQSGQNLQFLLISKKEFITKNPEILKRFLSAMVATEEFVKTQNEESKLLVQQQFNYDDEYMKTVFPKFKNEISLRQSLLLTMENQARWRIANKLTDKTIVPNYTDFIYTDALRKVKLDAVTLY